MSQELGSELNKIKKRVEKGITAMVDDKLPQGESDGFTDINNNVQKPSQHKEEVHSIVSTIMNALLAIGIIGIIVAIIAASGAARLSLCYNSYLGTSGYRSTLAYAALAFIFFPLYYPYYALVLNPICLKRIGRR
jgi:hypothetical protein